jgi:hypothetical protein
MNANEATLVGKLTSGGHNFGSLIDRAAALPIYDTTTVEELFRPT